MEKGGGGGVLRFVSRSPVLLISRVVPPIRSSTVASQHLYEPKSFWGNWHQILSVVLLAALI